jgi:thioredoxin-like negative regulator of GroEL
LEAKTKTQDLRLLKVDIAKWGSPVARQFGIDSIPHLLLYEDGALVAEGTRAVLAKLGLS